MLRHLNLVFPNTATDLLDIESVSRKSPSDLPRTVSVRRQTVANFPLTEVFSTDMIPMFFEIETMSVTALPDNRFL